MLANPYMFYVWAQYIRLLNQQISISVSVLKNLYRSGSSRMLNSKSIFL